MSTDTTPSSTTPRELAERYFAAWTARDETALRAVLADGCTFRGPLGTADGADECVAGLLGMARILQRVDVLVRAVDGDDVVTVFDLVTSVAEPATTANWMHVEDGRVVAIRVTFDPRGILSAG